MNFSKYNIYSKIENSDNFFIINSLTGSADIINNEEFLNIKDIKYFKNSEDVLNKYFIDEKYEQNLFKQKYLDFLDQREKDEIQIFFVPWYDCNFNCSYCYQSGYNKEKVFIDFGIIDKYFEYLEINFSSKKKYITLFGGEPLLDSEKHKSIIRYFFKKAADKNIQLSIVTNGYFLSEYQELLDRSQIREIQVTLDGTEKIHNSRRHLHNGKGTFNKIVDGIDKILELGITVNLRIVIDKENISELVPLSEFAIKKGWTNLSNFKTQLGRNYELHYCQEKQNKLFSRSELMEDLYRIIDKNPQVLEFIKPGFSISKQLAVNNEVPDPLFDACPGCKTEWAFDGYGNIYSCTATVGKDQESLGKFYPEIILDEDKVTEWQNRDITIIKECKECDSQLICGGGCVSLAKNLNGSVNSPDCRPIKRQLELGISLYVEKKLIK